VKTIGVGVYWDSNCSSRVSSINWGIIEPGEQKNVSIFIRNDGNANITLSLSTEDWNPANAMNYMTLTWNYNGQPLSFNQVIPVTLTLSLSSNATGITSFSFAMIFSGTG